MILGRLTSEPLFFKAILQERGRKAAGLVSLLVGYWRNRLKEEKERFRYKNILPQNANARIKIAGNPLSRIMAFRELPKRTQREIEEHVAERRNSELRGGGYVETCLTRGLEAYQTALAGRDPRLDVDEVLSRKLQARILIIGCGRAIAGRQLKKQYGNRVHVHGLSLTEYEQTQPPEYAEKHGELPKLDRYMVGHVHDMEQLHGKYDVVLMVHTLKHVIHPDLAVREVLNTLAPGGVAHIDATTSKPGTMTAGQIKDRLAMYTIGQRFEPDHERNRLTYRRPL